MSNSEESPLWRWKNVWLPILVSIGILIWSINADINNTTGDCDYTSKSGAWLIIAGAWIGYKLVFLKIIDGEPFVLVEDKNDKFKRQPVLSIAIWLVIIGTFISIYGNFLLNWILLFN